MKLCRFTHPDFFVPHYGIIEGDYVRALIDADAFGSRPRARADKLALADVRIVAPVAPLLFLKAPSSIIASGQTIQLPPESGQVEHEGELGVVIGRTACRIPDTDDPLTYVLGYTCVNDVTARDLQRKDVQFTRAK